MKFEIIDIDKWERKEYFNHYMNTIPCTYSISTKIDISELKKQDKNLYPVMLYFITKLVNKHDEFRTNFDSDGRLGIYTKMLPSYTIFNKKKETFSSIWTEYNEDYNKFYNLYKLDVEKYKDAVGMFPKDNIPENNFSVSMIPWVSFDGFNLNLQKGYNYMLPIFTIGKYYKEDNKYILPFAMQVHHAVCDGFHASRFINQLQELINLCEF